MGRMPPILLTQRNRVDDDDDDDQEEDEGVGNGEEEADEWRCVLCSLIGRGM